MKTFKELTEASKKIKGVNTSIVRKGRSYVAYIDGDILDQYSSEKEAKAMVAAFMKNYKG